MLIALVVAVMLVGTAAATLMTALQAEEDAQWFQDGQLAVQTVACRTFLGLDSTGSLSVVGEEWSASWADVRVTEPTTNSWRVCVLSPAARPSVTIPLAFLQDEAANR